jgi:hypothetical protein
MAWVWIHATPLKPAMRFEVIVASVIVTLSAGGCAHVAPYEREKLAHSTMSTEDLARASEDHVRAVHEGAVGGGNSSGGGCGCN